MVTMIDMNEMGPSATRKFRDMKHPAMKQNGKGRPVPVATPVAATAPRAPAAVAPPVPAPTGVDLARSGVDGDAQAALMKLRELVVGPAQQLNEARLEELIKIFEEREAELRSIMRDLQKRNAEMEVALKQNSLDQLNAFKNEFEALTDLMANESKKAIAAVRDEIAASRKETLDLVEAVKEVTNEKLEAQQARTKGLIETETLRVRTELATVNDKLEGQLVSSQRDIQHHMSRVLKDAAENMARPASNG